MRYNRVRPTTQRMNNSQSDRAMTFCSNVGRLHPVCWFRLPYICNLCQYTTQEPRMLSGCLHFSPCIGLQPHCTGQHCTASLKMHCHWLGELTHLGNRCLPTGLRTPIRPSRGSGKSIFSCSAVLVTKCSWSHEKLVELLCQCNCVHTVLGLSVQCSRQSDRARRALEAQLLARDWCIIVRPGVNVKTDLPARELKILAQSRDCVILASCDEIDGWRRSDVSRTFNATAKQANS